MLLWQKKFTKEGITKQPNKQITKSCLVLKLLVFTMKLKKGDQIIVIAGKDKGKKGKIEKVFPKVKKALIPGINVFKKHLKKRDEKNPGGIVEIIKPISLSKIALICPKCNQVTRVGYKLGTTKIRICKKCQEEI